MKTHLTNTTEGHSKFWSIKTYEENGEYLFSVCYGKIDTDGREDTPKTFSTAEERETAVDKLVNSKLKKGYVYKA